ncbi:unnamed protein product [Pylaiella littoralis]
MRVLKAWGLWVCLAAGPSWSSAVVGGDYTPEAQADSVDWSTLPGAENLAVKDGFNMFSGYINVDEMNGRNVFYWFMEAQENAEDAPVILWTNGGPGCSGMLGLLAEHGPFQVRDGGENLVDNNYSWNKIANMLYVEIPSGVGFSYSDTESDYQQTGDDKTAVDNYWLVQGWLERFPQYRRNDFHISSESYGGHYMPQLAEEILLRNKQARVVDTVPVINFAGFLVGNPYTDARSNQAAQYEAYWGDQLLPKFVYDNYRAGCVDTDEVLLGRQGDLDDCQELEQKMDSFIGNVNPYALDFPICLDEGGTGATVARAQRLALRDHHVRAMAEDRQSSRKGNEMEEAGSPARPSLKVASQAPYEPCAQDFTIPYLNRDDVQEALRVREGTVWEQCSTKVEYLSSDMMRPMMPYYRRLLNDHDIPILVFSGDDDAVCATEGTQWWIYNLGFNVDASNTWKTWEVEGQVAGYQTSFEDVKLSFVTVHSAGHEVPAYQPARAFKLLEKYLDGSWWGGDEDANGNRGEGGAGGGDVSEALSL